MAVPRIRQRALILREGVAPVRDRLLTMLFLATLLHGLVILGLTFDAAAGDGTRAPGLEVLLVSDELPEAEHNETATYLAQRTQLGSGNTRKPVPPRNRASDGRTPGKDGAADGNAPAEPAQAAGNPDERILTTTAWNVQVRYLIEPGEAGDARNRPLLLSGEPSAAPGPPVETELAQLRGPERDELWITPDSRESVLAPYLDAWRRKVERIGTLNYPTIARHSPPPLSPIVEVAISSEGELESVVIRRSSGSAELDQAALEILKLASPFDPFPTELARQYRVLRFAYEWQFVGGQAQPGTLTTVP